MNIRDYEQKIWSQFGEAGVLLELARRLDPPKVFVEIGCGDGSENNTRCLLERGWTGLWVDKDPNNVRQAKLVNPNTVLSLVHTHTILPLPQECGVLSIDVDGNDYWLWKHFGPQLKPWIVVVECQIRKPFDVPYVMPYDGFYEWDQKSEECGASVCSMEALGREMGYTSLGLLTDTHHNPNLFLVRDDLMYKLAE